VTADFLISCNALWIIGQGRVFKKALDGRKGTKQHTRILHNTSHKDFTRYTAQGHHARVPNTPMMVLEVVPQ